MSSLEYIWIDAKMNLRSKTKYTNEKNPPVWNYDGSSTGQAPHNDTEVELHPVATYNDPFRENGLLVLCEARKNNIPVIGNNRSWADQIFKNNYMDIRYQPWYGLEQEYFICDMNELHAKHMPIGYAQNKTQGQFYCSVGTGNAYGRIIAEEHYQACIKAGLKISGINAEVAVGQWEFQIGPVMGIEAGDQLWIARYILHRIAEKHNLVINFHPKPLPNWNGSGCHCNFSTNEMREKINENPDVIITNFIEKLAKTHIQHIEKYGEDNHLRLTGQYETANMKTFTSGVGDRSASIRIPNSVYQERKGYIEDRRPASNCDPYLVIGMLFQTYCL